MLLAINHNFTVRLKDGLSLDYIDFVLLHQPGNTVTHFVHHSILVGMGLGEIKA